jgi:ribosomal protein S12 methylthiotransferase accessory factor
MKTSPRTETEAALYRLENQLVNTKYGLVHTLQTQFPYPGEPPIYTANVWLSDHAHNNDELGMKPLQVGGSGAALSEAGARLSALCEGVERYCLNTSSKANIVVDNYANISQSFAALSPEECPLFHPDQYPAFKYSPFTPQTKIAWSWAMTLPQGNPILVPTDFVYLRYPAGSEVKRLMSTISTGAACGSSAADAVVRGIYEIVERDAMMIMWLNRHACPRLTIDPQSDLGQFMQRYLRLTNLSAHLFWIESELQIPACMAILLEGKPGNQRLFVGLSANLNPEQAATRSLFEAFQVRLGILGNEGSQELLATPEDITSIHKHGIYYIQQDRTHLLDFLLNTPDTIELSSLADQSTGAPETDLQTCLEHCCQAGQPVFITDMTKDDIRPLGLRVVRVIMPKMQQLTTNHNQPFLGNPRLFAVPVQLGWRDRPLTHKEINQDPHPFA